MRLCHVWENVKAKISLKTAGIHQGGKWAGQFGAEGFAGFGHGEAVFGENFYTPAARIREVTPRRILSELRARFFSQQSWSAGQRAVMR